MFLVHDQNQFNVPDSTRSPYPDMIVSENKFSDTPNRLKNIPIQRFILHQLNVTF